MDKESLHEWTKEIEKKDMETQNYVNTLQALLQEGIDNVNNGKARVARNLAGVLVMSDMLQAFANDRRITNTTIRSNMLKLATELNPIHDLNVDVEKALDIEQLKEPFNPVGAAVGLAVGGAVLGPGAGIGLAVHGGRMIRTWWTKDFASRFGELTRHIQAMIKKIVKQDKPTARQLIEGANVIKEVYLGILDTNDLYVRVHGLGADVTSPMYGIGGAVTHAALLGGGARDAMITGVLTGGLARLIQKGIIDPVSMTRRQLSRVIPVVHTFLIGSVIFMFGKFYTARYKDISYTDELVDLGGLINRVPKGTLLNYNSAPRTRAHVTKDVYDDNATFDMISNIISTMQYPKKNSTDYVFDKMEEQGVAVHRTYEYNAISTDMDTVVRRAALAMTVLALVTKIPGLGTITSLAYQGAEFMVKLPGFVGRALAERVGFQEWDAHQQRIMLGLFTLWMHHTYSYMSAANHIDVLDNWFVDDPKKKIHSSRGLQEFKDLWFCLWAGTTYTLFFDGLYGIRHHNKARAHLRTMYKKLKDFGVKEVAPLPANFHSLSPQKRSVALVESMTKIQQHYMRNLM